jgi:hypothetical protein
MVFSAMKMKIRADGSIAYEDSPFTKVCFSGAKHESIYDGDISLFFPKGKTMNFRGAPGCRWINVRPGSDLLGVLFAIQSGQASAERAPNPPQNSKNQQEQQKQYSGENLAAHDLLASSSRPLEGFCKVPTLSSLPTLYLDRFFGTNVLNSIYSGDRNCRASSSKPHVSPSFCRFVELRKIQAGSRPVR